MPIIYEGYCLLLVCGVKYSQFLKRDGNDCMGLRFRKSIKIAPGVRANLGKKSVGVSVGGKRGGVSYNSKTGARARASAPGTGLSYSTKISKSKQSATKNTAKGTTSSAAGDAAGNHCKPLQKKNKIYGVIIQTLSILLAVLALLTLFVEPVVGIAFILFAAFLFIAGRKHRTEVAPVRSNLLPPNELLKLQKILLQDSPDTLILSEEQLLDMAYQTAENSLRITNDCLNLLQTTVKPDVFFERLRLLTIHAQTLVSLEEFVGFGGASPTDLYNTLVDEKQEVIHDFLERYLSKTSSKADSLKTDNGKQNQYQKFYDSLKPYFSEMNDTNIAYITAEYSAHTQKQA